MGEKTAEKCPPRGEVQEEQAPGGVGEARRGWRRGSALRVGMEDEAECLTQL